MSKIINLSLRAKLLAMSGILAVLVFAVGALGVYGIKESTTGYGHVAHVNFPNLQSLARMRFHSTDISRLYLRLLLPGLAPEEVQKLKDKVDQAIAAYQKADKEYNDIPFVQGEKEIYDAQSKVWNEFLPRVRELMSLHGTSDPAGQKRYLDLFQSVLPKLRDQHSSALGELIAFQDHESGKWIQDSEADVQRYNWIAIGAALFGFILSLVFGYFLSTSLSRTLREIADKISGGANEVASATRQISNSSEELSASATQQASSLQETTASIEEMNAMVNKNAENATKSRESAQTGLQTATEGKRIMTEMIESMDRIGQSNEKIFSQIESSNTQFAEIVQVIRTIGEKTKVINDIVFQTKLLSFNASVEAARAGEHGKGFAVVAEEVGNLAAMSGKAAQEISDLLVGSTEQVEKIVRESKSNAEQLMASGKIEVTNGADIAKRCGTMLEEIVKNVDSINAMSAEIATACGEQASGIREINNAMGQLDQVTQQNASASQQTASATEELSAQAGMLRSTVENLMRLVNGGNSEFENANHGKALFREPITKKAPQPSTNVVPLKTKTKSAAEAPASAPSSDDIRFKEV